MGFNMTTPPFGQGSPLSTEPFPERVTVRALEYAVTAIPVKWQEHYDASSWSVRVCWRGPGDRWAVMWMGECYDAQGNYEYESNPSSRTDEFKQLFRFGLDDAIEIAKVLALKVRINGHNAEAFAKGLEDGTWT